MPPPRIRIIIAYMPTRSHYLAGRLAAGDDARTAARSRAAWAPGRMLMGLASPLPSALRRQADEARTRSMRAGPIAYTAAAPPLRDDSHGLHVGTMGQ